MVEIRSLLNTNTTKTTKFNPVFSLIILVYNKRLVYLILRKHAHLFHIEKRGENYGIYTWYKC